MRVTIEVQGPEHSGKTSLIAVVSRFLERLGAKVIIQRADPQIDEKLENGEISSDRIKGMEVFIRETNTH